MDELTTFVRAHDYDRYLSVLFAPKDRRADLFALYAFDLEISLIRSRISEPMPGEIRLQWWREVLAGERAGEVKGHPVAEPFIAVMKARHLSLPAFRRYLEAKRFDLYDDPMPGLNDLEGYAGETRGLVLHSAATILTNQTEAAKHPDLFGHGAVLQVITDIMKFFPLLRPGQQNLLPQDLLSTLSIDRQKLAENTDDKRLDTLFDELLAITKNHEQKVLQDLGKAPKALLAALLPVAFAIGTRKNLPKMSRYNTWLRTKWMSVWYSWRQAQYFVKQMK